jgi:RNA recognition motif-containing protein
MDASHLEGLFSNVGNVQNVSLQDLVKDGVVRRVAYVDMSSADEIRDCIERFHGATEDGSVLTVTEDRPHVPDPNYRVKSLAARKARKKASMTPRVKRQPTARPIICKTP